MYIECISKWLTNDRPLRIPKMYIYQQNVNQTFSKGMEYGKIKMIKS